MKMAAGLIRVIKRQVVKLSFDSVAEIAEGQFHRDWRYIQRGLVP